jgi:hypothetical protein
MTKFKFEVNGEIITSIVMSEEEFETLLGQIANGDPVVNVRTGGRMKSEDIEALRQAKHVPFIGRGSKTEFLFQSYDVETSVMSVIVRGQGQKILNQFAN